MLNDPELLMLFAKEKQKELRRTWQSAQRSPFQQTFSVFRRPAPTVPPPGQSPVEGAARLRRRRSGSVT